MKKQQVCTNAVLKDFNYQVNLPLEHAQVLKSKHVILNQAGAANEGDSISKDVRAPVIEMTFDIQTDVHANSQDPTQHSTIDKQYKINFSKSDLQTFF